MNISKVSGTQMVATGVNFASLTAAMQVALAIAAQVGHAGLAEASRGQASKLVMGLAYKAQEQAKKDLAEGKIEEKELQATISTYWDADKADILASLHDAALEQYTQNLGLHLNAGSAGKGKEKLVGVAALLSKAKTTVAQYSANIERTWTLGLFIKADIIEGAPVPEAMSKLNKRCQDEGERQDTAGTAGRATSRAAVEFAEATKQALIGSKEKPSIANPRIAGMLQGLLPRLSYLTLTAQGGNDDAIKALVAICEASETAMTVFNATKAAAEAKAQASGNTDEGNAETLPEPGKVEAVPAKRRAA